MTLEEQRQALLSTDRSNFGIYEAEADFFLQHMDEMERVRALGGLHVIGSERHESRRIDNQLRGRAARQGYPGSSRFYLSMEDELMRLFGGQQAENLMTRLRIDDATPLEVGLVSRLVEQSQTRVEGANFDIRKHLLEYDDVLNAQRAKVYDQRDLIFQKDDLSEDVTEMLQTEINQRVPQALRDPEGPWKLLAWLDQIQPSLTVNGFIYPSYTLKILVDDLLARNSTSDSGNGRKDTIDRADARQKLLVLADESLKAEEEHILQAVSQLLDTTQERYESQLREKLDLVDTFLEGQDQEEEEQTSPRQRLDELSALVRMPLKLSPEEQRLFRSDPEQVAETIRSQVTAATLDQSLIRLTGAVERRIEEDLAINYQQLKDLDWDALSNQFISSIQTGFNRRRERLIGINGDGQISKDLDQALNIATEPINDAQLMILLMQLPQGSKAAFDKRTHRRVWQRTTRLTYYYYAAQLVGSDNVNLITTDVLEHLQGAQSAMRYAWGRSEWSRLANTRPVDTDQTTQNGLRNLLSDSRYNEIKELPLQNLEGDEQRQIVDEFGRQTLTEIYRQLLLGVISELWVEYLTDMEALRVSIGLEAYGQRDPLVQYKSKAFEMFRELLDNMRSGVVTRMFTYRPRDLSTVQTTISAPRIEAPVEAEQLPSGDGKEKLSQIREVVPSKGKRHRRRR
jgi:preprotein translocase subunit SecA